MRCAIEKAWFGTLQRDHVNVSKSLCDETIKYTFAATLCLIDRKVYVIDSIRYDIWTSCFQEYVYYDRDS